MFLHILAMQCVFKLQKKLYKFSSWIPSHQFRSS